PLAAVERPHAGDAAPAGELVRDAEHPPRHRDRFPRVAAREGRGDRAQLVLQRRDRAGGARRQLARRIRRLPAAPLRRGPPPHRFRAHTPLDIVPSSANAAPDEVRPRPRGGPVRKLLLFAASLLLALAGGAASAQSPAPCDRACLGDKLDRFLDAVVAGDPSRAPLAIGFRQTQNSVLTAAGAGVWQTMTAIGPVQRRYFDPVTGNAAFFGVVTDGGEPAVASLR